MVEPLLSIVNVTCIVESPTNVGEGMNENIAVPACGRSALSIRNGWSTFVATANRRWVCTRPICIAGYTYDRYTTSAGTGSETAVHLRGGTRDPPIARP